MNIKSNIQNYIQDWERKCYLNGIPDEVPPEINNLVPSYKKIAIAILRNDVTLKTLGFTQPKSRVYSELKRIEISKRKGWHQLLLF